VIVFILCSVSFIVCVVLCAVFRLSVVLFCVMCLIVVPLPPGQNPFAVKINNNNNNNNKIIIRRICLFSDDFYSNSTLDFNNNSLELLRRHRC
jgi:hypothetical protein